MVSITVMVHVLGVLVVLESWVMTVMASITLMVSITVMVHVIGALVVLGVESLQ
jgi:hypothetical protein